MSQEFTDYPLLNPVQEGERIRADFGELTPTAVLHDDHVGKVLERTAEYNCLVLWPVPPETLEHKDLVYAASKSHVLNGVLQYTVKEKPHSQCFVDVEAVYDNGAFPALVVRRDPVLPSDDPKPEPTKPLALNIVESEKEYLKIWEEVRVLDARRIPGLDGLINVKFGEFAE